MVRGVKLAFTLALAWVFSASASVLVPTYVLPPDSFVRDQRSLGDQYAEGSQRTIKRLMGGHMKIRADRDYGDPLKNSFAFDEKSEGKFAGVIVSKDQNLVGPNQGVWDDGMLMSSAGEGKESEKKGKDDDEDKKTLSDQVAEGKYGLIQNEIFKKMPERPGVVSYEANSDTREKDNVHTLGGLKKDEIWLAEDHLLVLKGGSFPERTEESDRPWPAIDDYEAPRRQVKLPHKPKIPPPFPVRPSDDGPLVFLTPNGSVPAALFPPIAAGEGFGPFPPQDFPFPPNPSYAPGSDQGNLTTGGAPFPNAPFPAYPGNSSEGIFPPFLIPPSINGSFPEGFPPGAAFLPPPNNQTDLYDEDDPSIYYPPPYNFSYPAENSKVPAGPLVPGIVLPPPPDFFSWMEDGKTTTDGSTSTITDTTLVTMRPKYKRPTSYIQRKPQKRPIYTTTESPRKPVEIPTTTQQRPEIIEVTTVKPLPVTKVVQIPRPNPVRMQNYSVSTPKVKLERPSYKPKPKHTTKPPLKIIYDYPETNYERIPETTQKPFAVYGLPEKSSAVLTNSIVTSTPVPLRAYYASIPQDIPSTKLEPVYTAKQNENSVASFYFYDEQPKTTPKPNPFFDGRHYYETVNSAGVDNYQPRPQTGFSPLVDVTYGSLDQADSLLLWPQKQGPRTLTQEYFSVQKPRPQSVLIQHNRPDPFYQQLAEIQQTIDFYTTNRPKSYPARQNGRYKPKPPATPRPVYQFSFQSNQQPKQTRQQAVSFRAPKLDTEPFRPMVSYSKPFNSENDFNAITPSMQSHHQQYLVENVKVTTETPTSSKYYPKNNPKMEEYEDQSIQREKQNKKIKPVRTQESKTTPPKITQTAYPSTTANPLNHAYYTQQDERYFDAITKNYFDIFGKKIEDNNRDQNGIAVTPPIGTVRTPIDNGIDLVYAPESPEQPKPPSLASDTLVNNRQPLPAIEPESEFIPIPNPAYREQYQQIQQVPAYTAEQLDLINSDRAVNDDVRNYLRPVQPNYRRPWEQTAEINYPPPSLQHDTRVNWVNQVRPPLNPEAEYIQPINTAGEGRPGSFVSYRLPGEGAHVYFLTPQAAQAAQERYNYRAPGRR